MWTWYESSHRCVSLSEEISYESCADPQARDHKINRFKPLPERNGFKQITITIVQEHLFFCPKHCERGDRALVVVLYQGKKKHININKFAGLSRDWVGAKNLFMCFFGSFLMGEKKHINKIPPKIPGQSRETFVYVFCSLCVFSLPTLVKANFEALKCL